MGQTYEVFIVCRVFKSCWDLIPLEVPIRSVLDLCLRPPVSSELCLCDDKTADSNQ